MAADFINVKTQAFFYLRLCLRRDEKGAIILPDTLQRTQEATSAVADYTTRESAANGAACTGTCAKEVLQPLWLTPQEANALLQLCLTSDLPLGEEEQRIFQKLGELLRTQDRYCAG